MARLIELDELLKFPIRIDHCDKEHGNMDFVYGIETVLEYAEYLPIIDAVPVVRCKDCKHWFGNWYMDGCTEWHGHCHNDDEPVGRWESDFCSYGERRTET